VWFFILDVIIMTEKFLFSFAGLGLLLVSLFFAFSVFFSFYILLVFLGALTRFIKFL